MNFQPATILRPITSLNLSSLAALILAFFALSLNAQSIDHEQGKLAQLEQTLTNPPPRKSIFPDPDHVSVSLYFYEKVQLKYGSTRRLSRTIERIPIDTDLWKIRSRSLLDQFSGQQGSKTLCQIETQYRFHFQKGNREESIETFTGCNLLYTSENNGLTEVDPTTIFFLEMLAESAYQEWLLKNPISENPIQTANSP